MTQSTELDDTPTYARLRKIYALDEMDWPMPAAPGLSHDVAQLRDWAGWFQPNTREVRLLVSSTPGTVMGTVSWARADAVERES